MIRISLSRKKMLMLPCLWLMTLRAKLHYILLREKCPNTEFFLVCIFPHSDWIRRVNPYLSGFSPNAGKYGSEKTPYLDTFHAVLWMYLCNTAELIVCWFLLFTWYLFYYLMFSDFQIKDAFWTERHKCTRVN